MSDIAAIDTLRAAGWLYEPATGPAPLAERPLDSVDGSVRSWMASFSSLSNADETTWFLTFGDYSGASGDGFAWNEFESISLDAASSDAERDDIHGFWAAHMPILLSVRDGYKYLAVRHDHAIVYGEEPEFEQTEVIAPDLPTLLDLIIRRRGHARLESLLFL